MQFMSATATLPTIDQVYAQLQTLLDPELGVNLVDLGLIYQVKILSQASEAAKKTSPTQIYIKMTLTSPGCPLAGVFDPMIRGALQSFVGDPDTDIIIELTFDPPWTPDMMNEAIRLELGL